MAPQNLRTGCQTIVAFGSQGVDDSKKLNEAQRLELFNKLVTTDELVYATWADFSLGLSHAFHLFQMDNLSCSWQMLPTSCGDEVTGQVVQLYLLVESFDSHEYWLVCIGFVDSVSPLRV